MPLVEHFSQVRNSQIDSDVRRIESVHKPETFEKFVAIYILEVVNAIGVIFMQ